jgi:hypothetical protein
VIADAQKFCAPAGEALPASAARQESAARKGRDRNALLDPEELKRLPLSFAHAVAASSAVVLAEAGPHNSAGAGGCSLNI